MATAISNLGNGLGYIYMTKPDGTTVVASYPNTPENSRSIKLKGVESASVASARRAVGSITFTSSAGAGDITAITINGNNQISANIAFANPLVPTTTATDVRDAINSYLNAVGNYTAIAIGAVVYLIADENIGSNDNGQTISITTTAGLTTTNTTVEGGSDTNSIYDTAYGYRFFINSNYDSSGCSGCGSSATAGDLTNAVEITDYIVNQGLQNSINKQAVTIASGGVTVSRKSAITTLIVDTEASAASDNLDNINPTGFADYDLLILHGANSGRVVTVTESGNVSLFSTNTFDSAGYENTLILQYVGGTFYEVSRSPQSVASVAAFRTASFPFVTATNAGKTDLTAADNTLVTLTVNSSKRYNIVTGTATLTTGDYNITFSTTGAIAGDTFIVEYNANLTHGAGVVVIGGKTLTENESLKGGLVLLGYYDGAAWQTSIYYDLNGGYQLATANIGDSQVTVAKVESNLRYELVNLEGSFETGEVGDFKIKMPYPGTVSEIYSYATKAIAATDNGTITPKNNAGTTMTSGVITYTASDARGTAYTSTPTANNTFVAGDILTFTFAKTTAGGKATLTIKALRS